MNRRIYAVFLSLIFICIAFSDRALSWESDPTHRDITNYAAENSVLSEGEGNYLKNIGFTSGLDEKFQWDNNNEKITYWLREGSALEDKGNFWQVITFEGRFMNHFHNPLTSKDGGKWGEWDKGGLYSIPNSAQFPIPGTIPGTQY